MNLIASDYKLRIKLHKSCVINIGIAFQSDSLLSFRKVIGILDGV